MTALPLLQTIAGREQSGYIELRWFEGDNPQQQWVPVDALDTASERIASLSTKWDVFTGCVPRFRKGGGKDSIRRGWCVWVDCDGQASADRLADFTPQPTLTIASGSGPNRHAYWALSAPMAPALVEDANRRLAHRLGADVRCADVSRIMRPPGSFNHKTVPARPVVLVGDTGVAHSVSVLVADLPAPVSVPVPRARVVRVESDDDLLAIPPTTYVPALSGREPDRRGFVKCVSHGGGDERTPSLKVYATPERGWKCYGCGEGGSIYDFAALVWGMDTRGDQFIELKGRLRETFG